MIKRSVTLTIVTVLFLVALAGMVSALNSSVVDDAFTFDANYSNATTTNDSTNRWYGNISGATQTTGIIGEGYNFTDASADIQTSHYPQYGAGQEFTWSFWFMPSASPGTCLLDYCAQCDAAGDGLRFAYDTGKIKVTAHDGASSCVVTSTTSPTAGVWHNVIFLKNASGCRIYLDGVSEDNTSQSLGAITGSRDGIQFGNYWELSGDYIGAIDEFIIFNKSLTDDEIADVASGTQQFPFTPPATTTNIDLTATNRWNSTSLDDFNVDISWPNGTTTTHAAANGTVSLINVSNYTAISVNVTFFNMTDYFNETLLNVTATANVTTTIDAPVTQSTLNVTVFDLLSGLGVGGFNLTVSDGVIVSNYSTANGSITLFLNADNYQVNATVPGYGNWSGNYTTTVITAHSLQINLSAIINFFLYYEHNQTDFQVNLTNLTKLDVFCSNQTYTYTFTDSSMYNLTVPCAYDYMKVTVQYEYGGTPSSYYRTLIPAYTDKNVSFYLPQVSDTILQVLLNIDDLTGEYENGLMRVTKLYPGGTLDIIEQLFDIENSVTLYLIQNEAYIVAVSDAAGANEVVLGNLIATEAEEQTIIIPSIPFYPQEALLETNVTWAYNYTESLLRLQYEDDAGGTVVTNFTVYNGSNTSQALFSGSSSAHSATFTFNHNNPNMTYISYFNIEHSTAGSVTEWKSWGAELVAPETYVQSSPHGFEDVGEGEGWAWVLRWAGIFFILLLGFAFSAKHHHIALAVMVIFGIIIVKWGWWPVITLPILILSGILALVTFLREGQQRKGGI